MLAHAPCCQESGSTVGVHGTLALGATSRCLFTIDITKVIYAGLPVDISVFLCLRKQQPGFAQGQPTGYFETKELDKTTTVNTGIARVNGR